MSGHKCLLLLQRCVAARQLTFSTRFRGRDSVLAARRLFTEQRAWKSTTRAVCLQGPCLLQSGLKASFCTKAGETSDDNKDPPLPDCKLHLNPEQKEVYIVHVKGLPWSCSVEDLLHFFSNCKIFGGEKGIHLILNTWGKPIGQAFIQLEGEEDVTKALQMNRQYLGPRYVEVLAVTASDAENILESTYQDAPQDGVVRLRGFSYTHTKEDVARFLSGLDIVENGITIISDHLGRNSGVVYVQFSSQSQADEALKKNRGLIGNRYIEVFPSSLDDISSLKKMNHPAPYPTGARSANSWSTSKSDPKTGDFLDSFPSPHWIRMRGLPFRVSGQDIVKFFSPLVPSNILLECGHNGKLKGEAKVYFHTREDATAAMSRDKKFIGERYIELFQNSGPWSD